MANNVNIREKGASGRVCLLVLGMHRSGTSALARVLALLGADLPAKLMPASEANEAGYWESMSIHGLNDKLLASAGSSWDDWRAFDSGWHASPKAGEFKERAQAALDAEFGGSSFFVLKDPRFCRIAPFWLDALGKAGVQPLVVLPVRNPLEVAASLERRNGFPPELGHLIWLRHVLEAEAASRGLPRFHCSYDELMSDWPGLVDRAKGTLNMSWPRAPDRAAPEIDAFLAEELRHHRETPKRVTGNPALSAWLRDAFEIFSRWARDGENPADFAALDAIRGAFNASTPAFARLIDAGKQAATKAEAERAAREHVEAQLHEAVKRAEAERAARENAEAQLREVAKKVETETAARQRAEAQMRAAAKKAEAERAARTRAEADLATRFDEIAALTRLIREKELAARDRGALEVLLDPHALSLLPAPIRVWRQMARVRRSGIFDAEWYKRVHKDVAASGMDPLRHFVRYGFREGRAPNAAASDRRAAAMNATAMRGLPFLPAGLRIWWRMMQLRRSGIFDAGWYNRTYHDVAASGMNPLRHYVCHGAAEGRAPNAAQAAALGNGAGGTPVDRT